MRKNFRFQWYKGDGQLFVGNRETFLVKDLHQLASMINAKYRTHINATEIFFGEPTTPNVDSDTVYTSVGFGAGIVGWVVEEKALPAYTRFSREEMTAKEGMYRDELFRQGLGEHSGAHMLFESMIRQMGEMYQEIHKLRERVGDDNV